MTGSVAGASRLAEPLVLSGTGQRVTLPNRVLLAPMEGVTDSIFRTLVSELGPLGGAVTEFVRLSVAPASLRVLRAQLGPPLLATPVAVQFMASEPTHLAVSVAHAVRAGAAWIDLNFGCPAPIVFGKCAGSGLLAHPDRIAAIVAAAVAATTLPVTAKLRAGIDAPDRVAELVCAAAGAGAAAITLHARLKVQGYHQPATWSWIATARAALDKAGHRIPLIGNGAVEAPADAARLIEETGCDAVMVGRGALANPWLPSCILGGPTPTPAQAARVACLYHDRLAATAGPRVAGARLKQLIKWYRAGDLFAADPHHRTTLLRGDPAQILAWLAPARGELQLAELPAQ